MSISNTERSNHFGWAGKSLHAIDRILMMANCWTFLNKKWRGAYCLQSFYCRGLWMAMETIPHTAMAIPMWVHDPTLPQVQRLTKWVCPCHLQQLQKLKIQFWSPRVWSSGPGWMSGEWKQTSYGSFDLSRATHLTVIVSRETWVRPFKVVCQADETVLTDCN